MTERSLVILYGSQGGTAQDIAERIWRESRLYGFTGKVFPMDEYDIKHLIYETTALFICSTTGQGDQPDNMKKFWRFLLRKSLPDSSLQNVRFAVLGLGDSSYAKFNHVAKKLYRRLLNLGAESIYDLGLADDQHDLGADAIVDPWIKGLWATLPKTNDATKHIDNNSLLPPRWNVTKLTECITTGHLSNDMLTKENSFTSRCIANDRVTAIDHFQDVRLIKFTLSENVDYIPGDVLMIKPVNCEDSVKEFFKLFSDRSGEINEKVGFQITKRCSDMPVPYSLLNTVQLETIVREYWDLNVVPRRYVFELMAHFTDSDLEKEKLTEFVSSEGQQDLYTYCNKPRRTILEVLADFPHATSRIPLDYLFEIFQPIRPRAFSIASSPKVHKGEVHILVAVVKYKTILKKTRHGLCSNWLASLSCSVPVPLYIRKGSFIFPKGKYVPVIMVGPGTGIAPFRSFAHEELQDHESHNQLYIYFGCRNKSADYYFENEWSQMTTSGRLIINTAFSRDQDHKIYVQNIIENDADVLWNQLSNPMSSIFVAGNSKNMPNAVRNVFIGIFARYKKISMESAEKVLEEMELKNRYQTETWS